jgi:hypothetical protein
MKKKKKTMGMAQSNNKADQTMLAMVQNKTGINPLKKKKKGS